MKHQRLLWIAILSASVIVACTFSFLPLGPSLPESRRLGDMTIHYPGEWYTEGEGEILAISAEEIVDIFELQPQPVLIAIYGHQEDWVRQVFEDESDLLGEIADEIFAESIGSEEIVEGRGVSWHRASAEGTFDIFESPVVGWLAVVIREDEFAFILVGAQESVWEEYEDIFDAMLERIEFN